MEVALLLWNKFLRPVFHSAGVCSSAGGGCRRRELSGSGGFAYARSVPDLGVCCLAIQSGMVRLLVARCRGMAVGLVVAWWVDLCFSSPLAGELRRAMAREVWGASPADVLSP